MTDAPEIVELNGRRFVPLLRYETLAERLSVYAAALNVRYAEEAPVIVPVLSGACRVFAELALRLRVAYEVDFVKISSYGAGMESGQLALQLPLSHSVAGRSVIVLEDIVDTGRTSDFLHDYLREQGASRIEFYSLLFKESCFQGRHAPTDYGFSIAPEFVVGFGLDYGELGRWLPHVYRLEG